MCLSLHQNSDSWNKTSSNKTHQPIVQHRWYHILVQQHHDGWLTHPTSSTLSTSFYHQAHNKKYQNVKSIISNCVPSSINILNGKTKPEPYTYCMSTFCCLHSLILCTAQCWFVKYWSRVQWCIKSFNILFLCLFIISIFIGTFMFNAITSFQSSCNDSHMSTSTMTAA